MRYLSALKMKERMSQWVIFDKMPHFPHVRCSPHCVTKSRHQKFGWERPPSDVGYAPNSDRTTDIAAGPFRAIRDIL